MRTELLFGSEARSKLLAGATKLAQAVSATLGPRGRNVIIERLGDKPLVTRDGATVAEHILVEDKFENLGASLLREAAQRTAELAGDGTSTSTVLALSLLANGQKAIDSGIDPILLKHGMELALKDVTSELQKLSNRVTNFKEIENVGSISANNDKLIGSLIATAMEKVGREGVITIEATNNFETKLELVQGMKFDKGYISQHFVTNTERLETVFDNALIFVTNKKFSTMSELLPLLEAAARNDKELFIIANDVDGEALNALIVNKLRNALKVCAVRAPAFGDTQKQILQDIAVLTGGHFFDADIEKDFIVNAANDLKQLGRARRVIAAKHSTTIVDGEGTQEAIIEKIKQLKTQLETEQSDRDIELLRMRIASLSGGVAVIRVGAYTEAELKEKLARIEDALSATKAAVDEGIVCGGGLALYRIAQKLKLTDGYANMYGYNLVIDACEEPFRKINLNAGQDPDVLLGTINVDNEKSGYNTLTGIFTNNMFDEGIIDPAKVERCAVENAVSAACLLLTTDTLITTYAV